MIMRVALAAGQLRAGASPRTGRPGPGPLVSSSSATRCYRSLARGTCRGSSGTGASPCTPRSAACGRLSAPYGSWNTICTRRWSWRRPPACSRPTEVSPNVISPEVGRSEPVIILASVLFPAATRFDQAYHRRARGDREGHVVDRGDRPVPAPADLEDLRYTPLTVAVWTSLADTADLLFDVRRREPPARDSTPPSPALKRGAAGDPGCGRYPR